MIEVSTRLNDNGSACYAVIQETGVAGIGSMTDEQRANCFQKVSAL